MISSNIKSIQQDTHLPEQNYVSMSDKTKATQDKQTEIRNARIKAIVIAVLFAAVLITASAFLAAIVVLPGYAAIAAITLPTALTISSIASFALYGAAAGAAIAMGMKGIQILLEMVINLRRGHFEFDFYKTSKETIVAIGISATIGAISLATTEGIIIGMPAGLI